MLPGTRDGGAAPAAAPAHGSAARPSEIAVFLCCLAAMAIHQSFRWDWYIDDAAICFAYARNLAEGLGWVPWPGGERIEAVSDPTWVVLLALFQAAGLDGFTVSKPLAMLFGAGTLWIAWRTARLALPEHHGPGALVAPIALALNAQFAIWSASGLENALFCLLLAGAIHRTVLECARPSFPWAAALYVLLAWTRPEGVLYAGVGGAVFLGSTLRAGRGWRPALRWAGVLLVPLVLSEVARIAYFAWPLPNTFYAKIASRGVAPLEWDSRGWNQLRDWAGRLWHGYAAPVYLIGLTGVSGRAARIGLAVVGALALSLLWPGPEALRALWWWPALPEPPGAVVVLRTITLIAAGVLLPLLALRSPAPEVRVLCGWTVAVGLGFSIYANGDWMGAYRFMSLVSPALAVLLASGVASLLDALESWQRQDGRPGPDHPPSPADPNPDRAAPTGVRWGTAAWVAGALGVGLLIPPNLAQTRDHVLHNRNETTASVKLRVDYTRSILRRTFWEEPVTNLEVDQGAHLWWAPDYVEVDMAMLVDVPMARHWYQQRAFVREYVFEEKRPTFAHVGGWWAEHTGLRRYPEWQATFFELPGYRNLPPMGWFRNVFARRELVMAERWDGPAERRTTFDWNLVLEGVHQPAPWVAGAEGYLEVPFSVTKRRQKGQEVQVWGFVSTGGAVLASFSLPMGYGFYPMHEWRPSEVFRGRHAVPVPPGIPPGTYDLGFVLTGPRGRVIPAEERPPGAAEGPPVFAAGEVRFPGALEVVDPAALVQRIEAARARVHELAAHGDCEKAEQARITLLRHRPVDGAWRDEVSPPLARALADCWAVRAERAGSRQVDWLARSHRWDPRSPELERVAEPIGERLMAEGRAARAAQDWQTAYDRFAAVLRFQPWRAWARRYAEEARDHRLDLLDDVRIGIGGENDLRASEERSRK